MRQQCDSSGASLAICYAVLVLYPFPEGAEHRGLRISVLDHFLRAPGTNLPDLSHRYHGQKCDGGLPTVIAWAQAPGTGHQHMNQKFVRYEGFSGDTKFSIKCSDFLCLELVYTI